MHDDDGLVLDPILVPDDDRHALNHCRWRRGRDTVRSRGAEA